MSKITTKQIGEVIIQSEGEKPRITRENLQAFIRNPDAFGQVEFYPVSVGCGMTFDDLVSAGHYYSAGDENIKSDFQIESTGACVVDCELVRLNCDEVNFEDMLAHLKIIGMRPTTIEEFLTFGCKYPDVQREFPVVCLSPWTDLDGNRCALCLTTSHKQRILGFTPLESNWLGHTRFLAVSR